MNPQDIIKTYARQSIDYERDSLILGFSLRGVVINHRRFDAALTSIATLHHSQRQHQHGGGILLYGPSGIGKSTILETYAKNFPTNNDGRQTLTPVLMVVCPSSATANGLVSAMFDALGYPIPARTDLADKTIKLCKLIRMHKVELLLIDEFQHTYYSRSMSDFRQLVDTVKNIISTTKVASVLVGLGESEEVICSNEQLARRHSERIEITTFGMNKEDFSEFRAVLKAYQEILVIKPETPLFEANLARRFLIASDGNLDYLRRILEKSIEIAGLANLNNLNDEVYGAAFRDGIWKTVPEKLNPFHSQSLLRRLDKRGEPYYPWHSKHAIGSPLARRNISKSSGDNQL